MTSLTNVERYSKNWKASSAEWEQVAMWLAHNAPPSLQTRTFRALLLAYSDDEHARHSRGGGVAAAVEAENGELLRLHDFGKGCLDVWNKYPGRQRHRMEAPPARHTALVWVDPGRYSGEPCLYGTRIPTRMIANYVFGGTPVDGVAASYNVNRPLVLGACWYEATHGTSRMLRAAWKEWADRSHGAMWGSQWNEVQDPPAKES